MDGDQDQARVLKAKRDKGCRIAMIAPAFNEGGKIEKVVAACPRDLIDEFLVMDDGTTDGSMALVAEAGGTVHSTPERRGIGFAIANGLRIAREQGFDIVVIIAGNGKDDPRQVHRLLKPLLIDGVDYVQGSRYLSGGAHGNMPLHRSIVTRLYPMLLSLLTGRRITDGTNGYRSYWLNILDKDGIDTEQDWLHECMEYYLAVKVYRSNLTVSEVPVSKIYPKDSSYGSYTKVRPEKLFHRLLPLIVLTLGLRK